MTLKLSDIIVPLLLCQGAKTISDMKMFDDVGKNFLELPIPFYAQMEIVVKDVCTYYRTCEKQRKANFT